MNVWIIIYAWMNQGVTYQTIIGVYDTSANCVFFAKSLPKPKGSGQFVCLQEEVHTKGLK